MNIKISPFLPIPYLVPCCDMQTKHEYMIELPGERIDAYYVESIDTIFVSKERFESMSKTLKKALA